MLGPVHQVPQLVAKPYPFDGITPDASARAGDPASDLNFLLAATGYVSPEELKQHALEVQKKAFELFPYPCIRDFAFLSAKPASHEAYSHVLSLGTVDPNAIYLDLGCFFGTDVRKIVMDGWDARNAIASDIHPEWFELGHSFFQDQATSQITFLAGDVFDDNFLPRVRQSTTPAAGFTPPMKSLTSLAPLQGRIRAISVFSVFHLFQEDQQFELAQKLGALLDPRPGSVIFGSHTGGLEKGHIERRNSKRKGAKIFVHSPQSWIDLWETEIFPANRDGQASEGMKVKVSAGFAGGRTVDGEDRSSSQGLTWSVVVI